MTVNWLMIDSRRVYAILAIYLLVCSFALTIKAFIVRSRVIQVSRIPNTCS